MRKERRVIGLVLFIVCTAACTTAGQSIRGGSGEVHLQRTLVPSLRAAIGLYGSLLRVFGIGSFTTSCESRYEGGEGLGAAVGLAGDVLVARSWKIAVACGWRRYACRTEEMETRLEYDRGEGRYVSVDFERNASVTVSYLSLSCYGEWFPGNGRFALFAGPHIGVYLGGTVHEEEKILSSDYVYTSGRRTRTFLDGDLSLLSDPKLFRWDIEAGAAYEWKIGPTSCLTPRLAYSYPLRRLVSAHPSWSLAVLNLTLQLSMEIAP
ncbi:MAG: outer membrane beta-barrel protein [Bacteroidota bacterium]|nr:outer membrane beta-barrel protein [Bacteroidota bacterium]